MNVETEQLAGALDTISFLARSPGRIHVLNVLAEADDPHDRASLREETDVPRTTVGRIVTHLHERDLVIEQGRECRITPLGEMLMTEFDSLLRTAVTVETLRPVLRWLPVEELDFGLGQFADADITLATPHDTTAAIDRAIEFIGNGDSVRIVAFGVAPRVIEAAWQATVHGEQTHEFVLAAGAVDALSSDRQYCIAAPFRSPRKIGVYPRNPLSGSASNSLNIFATFQFATSQCGSARSLLSPIPLI